MARENTDGTITIGTCDGTPIRYPLWGNGTTYNGLIVGGPGSGTTTLAASIVTAARAAVPTVTMHLAPEYERSGLAASATWAYPTGPFAHQNVFRLNNTVKDRRERLGGAAWEPSPDMPLVLVVIDAVSDVFGPLGVQDRTHAADKIGDWEWVTRFGTAVGVAFLAVSRYGGLLSEFGGSYALRSELANNVIALRLLGQMAPLGVDVYEAHDLGLRDGILIDAHAKRHEFTVPALDVPTLVAQHADAAPDPGTRDAIVPPKERPVPRGHVARPSKNTPAW
ncbi:hypothetical protein ACFS2C_28050 [Prauserella oleivorans]|uniref:FtsK domain-containing protein n=1 Tax=Prauserella oleivorans TaxID=1478153 RepID=A0ABW5WI83_9PSEU